MIDYLLKKIRERKERKAFKEYEFKTVTFNLLTEGPVQYAQCPATEDEKLELYDLLTSKKYNHYRTDFTPDNKVKILRENMAVKSTYDILAIPQEKEKQ